MVPRSLSDVGGRRLILALGGLYVAVGVTVPFLPAAGNPLQEALIISLLVSGAGIVLLYGAYRLPRAEIDPVFFSTVAGWCFRAMGVMVGIILFIWLTGNLDNPLDNFLILPALSALAGFAVGRHDARAKTHAYVLEQRNEELQQTKADLEETVDQFEKSEQRYRTVTENFPNGGVALLDDDLRHTLVAGRGFRKLDFSASDLQGERVQNVYQGDVLERIESNYTATLDGEPTTFEVEIGERTFEFRAHPLTDDGDVYAILAISQDVTGRKQREQELAQRARQQQAIADLGQLALKTDDLDELMHEAAEMVGDVLANEYCKVLELDEAGNELLLRQGVGWRDGIVGEATVSATENDSQAAYTLANDHPIVVEDLDTEERFSGPELLRSHDVKSGISTVIGPFDEPWGILGTHDTDCREYSTQDVVFVQSVANVLAEAIERHRYEEDLEHLVDSLQESNERLEQFAYAASHDLQEPLRMVSTYLQLIDRRYEDELDEDGREFLEFAVDGADRMRSMIDGLLQYSRVETGADPFEPVDLEGVFEDVCDDLQVAIEASDATVTTDALPRVLGDPNQLRQVFQNVLDNAITYSGDDSPSVHVSAQRDGTDWIVTVQDEGIGIDSRDRDRVFDVFEQVHDRQEGAGTGIGLALCERIVERHDGEIWIDSTAEEGTAVSFSLPAVDDRQ